MKSRVGITTRHLV